MNDKEMSLYLDLKFNYFSVLKCTNKEKYNYIFSFDKYNRLNSINKYNKYVSNLIDKVIDIYYSYEKPYYFAKWLKDNKLYSFSCAQSIEKLLFKTYDNYLNSRLSVIDKLENIILYHYTNQ